MVELFARQGEVSRYFVPQLGEKKNLHVCYFHCCVDTMERILYILVFIIGFSSSFFFFLCVFFSVYRFVCFSQYIVFVCFSQYIVFCVFFSVYRFLCVFLSISFFCVFFSIYRFCVCFSQYIVFCVFFSVYRFCVCFSQYIVFCVFFSVYRFCVFFSIYRFSRVLRSRESKVRREGKVTSPEKGDKKLSLRLHTR